jgi:hypothetical protein
MIPANLAFHSLHKAINGASMEAQPEPNDAPIAIEKPVEKLSLDANKGLIEEVRIATISPAYKGFGN